MNIDPRMMGLLTAAAAGMEASGPSRTPVSTGQVMSRGLLSGLGAYQQSQDSELKRGLLGAQLKHMGMQDKILQAQLSEAQRKAQLEAQLRAATAGLFGDPGVSPQQALMNGGGPTNENASLIRPGNPGAFNPSGLPAFIGAGGKLSDVKDLMPDWKVQDRFNAETGRSEKVLVDMRNPQNVMPFGGQQAMQLQRVNLGGQNVGVDPITGEQVGSGLEMSVSPDALLTDSRTRSEGALNRGVTMRGQNMADARAGQSYDPERGLVVDLRGGTATPVMAGGAPIGPKDKGLNDSQSKALLFSNRMEEADKIIADLSMAGTNASIPGMMNNGNANSIINTFAPADQQQLAQAKRNFLNAVLRRESGAVIGPSEFANGDRQYFPQIGDSKAVIEQKAANRKAAIDGIKAEIPRGYSGPDRRATPAATTKVLNGKTYINVNGKWYEQS